MELLAGFFFDTFGIGLKLGYVSRVLRVFLLQSGDVFLQALILRAFCPINNHAIGAKGHVQEEPDCNQTNCNGRKASTKYEQFLKYWFNSRTHARGERFRVVGAFGQ